MSNKFTNNVRARLYKQGYLGFTKDDYTDAALAVGCDELDNPTKEQLNQAVEYLIEKQSKQIVVVPQKAENTSIDPEPVKEIFPERTVVAQPEQEFSQLTVTNTSDVGELVTSKAAEMGVIISSKQVNEIADSVDTSASTFEEVLEQVEQALLAYADYSANQVDARINQTLSRVQNRVVHRHEQSRDKLAQGLNDIGAALESSRTQTKREISGILSRLNAVK